MSWILGFLWLIATFAWPEEPMLLWGFVVILIVVLWERDDGRAKKIGGTQ